MRHPKTLLVASRPCRLTFVFRYFHQIGYRDIVNRHGPMAADNVSSHLDIEPPAQQVGVGCEHRNADCAGAGEDADRPHSPAPSIAFSAASTWDGLHLT